MSGDAIMKSRVLRLQATGTFQTTAMRRSAVDVRVVRLRLRRIPEEDQQVQLALRDHGSDLLVATKRAAQKLAYCESELRLEQGSGGPRREQIVSAKDAAVESSPLEQTPLLIVMGDQPRSS